MRTVYVNGEYLPEDQAKVSIFDRGFLMADGVYEVTSVLDGKLIDFDGHAVRLARSLSELEMRNPISKEDLLEVHRELVRVNEIDEGLIYLQITRGSDGDRDFAFPDPETTEPTVVLFTQNKPGLADSPAAKKGAKIISIEDIRWGRRDIKTVQLLYPSMGKMMAKKAGVEDAWMVEDGFVTEGTSNNAYIVKDDKIVTRETSNDILHGITRKAVLELAREAPVEADLVCPVPDSGTPAAIGFAQEATLPFELGIIRNHYVGRTFIAPSDNIRHMGVKLKHNANRKLIEGKKVVLVDDSIVRGTTSQKIVAMVRDAGAAEVHMRIASPPTISGCFYGVDTPEKQKLLASRMEVQEMADFIKVDSLAFLTIDGLYRAAGEAARNGESPQFCDACFSGDYPTRLLDREGIEANPGGNVRPISMLSEAG